jgi:hypothetical protein
MTKELDENTYIRITPQQLTLSLIRRLASEIAKRTNFDVHNWWLIIPDLDNALTCQLIAYLSGTMQLGALSKEHQELFLIYLNDNHLPGVTWPTNKKGKQVREKIAPLRELLERAMDPKFSFIDNTQNFLRLNEKELVDILKLHEFRNDLAHVKPRNWSLEVIGIPRMATACVKAIEQLFANCSARIHLTVAEIEEMDANQKLILDALSPTQIKKL